MRRLKTWTQFQAVMAAKAVAHTPHFALHLQHATPQAMSAGLIQKKSAADTGSGLVVGALTPKRWAKCAVTRNLVRRQVHEVLKDLQQNLQPAAYVVRLRASFDRQKYTSASSGALKKAVADELRSLMAKVSPL